MTLRFAVRMFVVCSAFLGLEMFGVMEGARERGFEPDWPRLIALSAVRWYSWMAVAPFVHRAAVRGVNAGRPVRAQLPVAAVFVVVHQALLTLATALLGWGYEQFQLRDLPPRLVPDIVLYTGLAWALTSIEARKHRAESDARMRAALAEARLDALRQQLNPHFLFNTLNHIVMQLRLNEPAESMRMLIALGDLLHLVLQDTVQLTPVSREMEAVELYLEIERARFGAKLQVDASVDAHVLDAMVPSLLLQPLLENAMRHGVSPVDGSCRVQLTVRERDGRLVIDLRDEGPGTAAGTAGTGIGLANTRERLRHLYGDDHRFAFDAIEGAGARVRVDIPLRRAS